jgi:uncharacterized protein with predicted RNA binding PUA domain
MDDEEHRSLATVADYQFGAGAGDALFPAADPPRVERTRSGRPRQLHVDGGSPHQFANGRIATYEDDGRFRLGLVGGRRLLDALPSPACRVVVGEESVPFVRDGRNAMAKFVRDAGTAIRPGDEVCVVGPDDALLAVGRAEMAASAMHDFGTGMAVKVRNGAGEPGGGGAVGPDATEDS